MRMHKADDVRRGPRQGIKWREEVCDYSWTHHRDDYVRATEFDPESAYAAWEGGEEKEEQARQLQVRWEYFERDLPSGGKCEERRLADEAEARKGEEIRLAAERKEERRKQFFAARAAKKKKAELLEAASNDGAVKSAEDASDGGAVTANVLEAVKGTTGAPNNCTNKLKAGEGQKAAAAEDAALALEASVTADDPAGEDAAGDVAPALETSVTANGTTQMNSEFVGTSARLALSNEDLVVYRGLWDSVQQDGLIGAKAAVDFLQTSGVLTLKLRKIWALSDTRKPKGSLTEEEFFTALKLVAIVQQNHALSLDNLAIQCPLPTVTGAPNAPEDARRPATSAPPAAEGTKLRLESGTVSDKLALTEGQHEAYCQLWDDADADGSGFIGAKEAVAFFQRSKLPLKALKAIWSLADRSAPKGRLSVNEFFMALKLIALAQNKQPVGLESLTESCPLPVMASPVAAAGQHAGVQVTALLNLSEDDAAVYHQLWVEADPVDNAVVATSAVGFLKSSRLPTQDLRRIWALTAGKKPALGKDDFFAALKLVAARQVGGELETASLSTKTPLPRVGSLRVSE